MPVLPLLAQPAAYRPCIQDLLADGAEVRGYWLDLFEAHLETLASLPTGEGHLRDQGRWEVFRRGYLAELGELRRDPARRGRLNVLELTRFREEQFEAAGIGDPFAELKRRENALALRALPDVLRDVDAASPRRRLELLVRGLLAGNLFDMGSKAAVDAYQEPAAEVGLSRRDGGAFLAMRDRLRPRPWPVDDLDAWLDRSVPVAGPGGMPKRSAGMLPRSETRCVYRQALLFVDNAGPDVILGAIPLARELARLGTRVVLAANSRPALNDVTAAELPAILGECAGRDATLAALVRDDLTAVVASGGDAPLIDLAELTPECCEAAAVSDLLILEGMGRAIESNFDARFTVDTLKIALIKDRMVARVLGVELFDPVFRFEPGGEKSKSQKVKKSKRR